MGEGGVVFGDKDEVLRKVLQLVPLASVPRPAAAAAK
jgi:hypothetical protein